METFSVNRYAKFEELVVRIQDMYAWAKTKQHDRWSPGAGEWSMQSIEHPITGKERHVYNERHGIRNKTDYPYGG